MILHGCTKQKLCLYGTSIAIVFSIFVYFYSFHFTNVQKREIGKYDVRPKSHGNQVSRWNNLTREHVSTVQMPKVNQTNLKTKSLKSSSYESFTQKEWQQEYESRLKLHRRVCQKEEVSFLQRVRRIATNKKNGHQYFCTTKRCPVILDEEHVLYFCFIQKVASTSVKEFFFRISNISINTTLQHNLTAFHLAANDALQRISPTHYPPSTLRRFLKVIFVRHPFDRLVSAFRDKGERPRDEVRYFYDEFWDPVMRITRGPENVTLSSRITFIEFIWYLLHTLVYDYDEHWAPYWIRCSACSVEYDFIGKLETADHDFRYVSDLIGVQDSPIHKSNVRKSHEIALEYFKNVPRDTIIKLSRVYRMDFELFNYTLDGFLPVGDAALKF